MSDDNFLSRWSRLKKQSRAPQPAAEAPVAAPPPASPPQTQPADAEPGAGEPRPLPPVESLTPESDFSPFMKDEVDESLRRVALKKLFGDPRFNVMDGLDVYIDDYSKPDPLPEGWLAKMSQVARLGAYQEPDPAEPESPPQAPGEAPLAEPAAGENALPEEGVGALSAEPDSVTGEASQEPPPVVESPPRG